ncbi:hypothetical protein PGS_00007200 [Porphyromonas gingivalis A7A1-28]|nr:hypothetical protein PGS_00007200 [Porphyromonas gingivalis A7A1-28]SJL33329.1 transcriptional regulator [Porphyromonas gingivalis]
MNAIMHRDYEGNAPIQFYEYDDHIEIQNPGGLYGKVSPDNFPNVSDYRNPFIAEAMKVLGYVNRFSRGVYRVQKELEENGNGQASFDFSLITAFRVVESVSQKYFEEGFGGEAAQEKSKKDPRKAQERPKKSPRNIEDEILDEIKNFPQVTRKDLAKRLNRTEDSIRYYLRRMVNEGVIKHEGSTKAGKWVIIK